MRTGFRTTRSTSRTNCIQKLYRAPRRAAAAGRARRRPGGDARRDGPPPARPGGGTRHGPSRADAGPGPQRGWTHGWTHGWTAGDHPHRGPTDRAPTRDAPYPRHRPGSTRSARARDTRRRLTPSRKPQQYIACHLFVSPDPPPLAQQHRPHHILHGTPHGSLGRCRPHTERGALPSAPPSRTNTHAGGRIWYRYKK